MDLVPQLLECTRDASPTSDRRHIRVIGEPSPLCGTKDRQLGAGAGSFVGILRWANCRRCTKLARAYGPHPLQNLPYIACPQCGQSGQQPPGLRFVKGGAEAAMFAADDSTIVLTWIECRKCGHRWPERAGSVTGVKA